MARLGCIIAVLLVPLLLLASPGRAVTRSTGPDGRTARSDLARLRATTAALPGWAAPLVVAADWRTTVTTTTTTTTTLPPTTEVTRPAPQVRAAAVTATTAAPPPPPTTAVPVTTAVPRSTTTTAAGHEETGEASWYYASEGTCASPTLAFGTVVTVTDLANGNQTTCTVDDRQDASTGRVLDLAEASFAKLADPSQGVIEVRLNW